MPSDEGDRLAEGFAGSFRPGRPATVVVTEAGRRSPGDTKVLDLRLAPRGRKRYRRGTSRACDPAETFRRISPHLERLGITRVANITGLDRLGIPVFVAVRPNSRSVATSLGKAGDPMAARVSAIMESVETHHAEVPTCLTRVETWDQMAREVRVADPDLLPRDRHSLFSSSYPIPWVQGQDVSGGDPLWVPFEMVHTNYCIPPVAGSGCFRRSSNGLASGNTLAEAMVHGLCEVIERDALEAWSRHSGTHRSTRRIDLDTVEDELCAGLLERCRRADFGVMAWDLTGPLEAPVMLVELVDLSTEPVLNPIPVALGSGCHPEPAVALARALTESAQVRLGFIAGSRDDTWRRLYPQIRARATPERLRAIGEPGPVRFGDCHALGTPTIEGDLQALVRRLSAEGFPSVVLVDLSWEDIPVRVIRCIVPGMKIESA